MEAQGGQPGGDPLGQAVAVPVATTQSPCRLLRLHLARGTGFGDPAVGAGF